MVRNENKKKGLLVEDQFCLERTTTHMKSDAVPSSRNYIEID